MDYINGIADVRGVLKKRNNKSTSEMLVKSSQKAQTDLSDDSSSVTNSTIETGKKGAKWHSVWDLRFDKSKKKKKQRVKEASYNKIVKENDVENESQFKPIEEPQVPEAESGSPRIMPTEFASNLPSLPVELAAEISDYSAPPTTKAPSTPTRNRDSEKPISMQSGRSQEHVSRFTRSFSLGSRVHHSIPEIPKLPKGKKLLETVIFKDVDSLYRSMFDNESFFEIVTRKTYDGVRKFQVTPWVTKASEKTRQMSYNFPKTIAFTQHDIQIEQVQTQASYSQHGLVYGIDCVTNNRGIVYSDYFEINIHYRLTAENENTSSRLVVMGDIVFVKPCIFKNRIETEAWSGLNKYYEMLEKEVQLEKTSKPSESVESDSGTDEKTQVRTKDYNDNQVLSSSYKDVMNSDYVLMSDRTFLIALTLSLVTLFVITLVMIKLSNVIAILTTRLDALENLLEAYSTVCLDQTKEN